MVEPKQRTTTSSTLDDIDLDDAPMTSTLEDGPTAPVPQVDLDAPIDLKVLCSILSQLYNEASCLTSVKNMQTINTRCLSHPSSLRPMV